MLIGWGVAVGVRVIVGDVVGVGEAVSVAVAVGLGVPVGISGELETSPKVCSRRESFSGLGEQAATSTSTISTKYQYFWHKIFMSILFTIKMKGLKYNTKIHPNILNGFNPPHYP
jgi:hypothetical protein